MVHCIFIGIDYDDAYKAVQVDLPDGTETRFETGDPPADWRAAIDYARAKHVELGVPAMTLSSIDGFVFDVMGWRFDENEMLILDERDYHPDGRLKTRIESDLEFEEADANV